MLYQFFIVQWHKPSRGDWTKTVKRDLEDIDIPCDFKFLRSKSTESFKKLVKIKTRELALRVLVQKQVQHSKMDAHSYLELKPQNYLSLKNDRIEHVRNVFRFRTRMANFGDNFKSS